MISETILRHELFCLQTFAQIESSYLEFIKSEGAVGVVSAAMEHHPDLELLTLEGSEALKLFADQQDLEHAMEVIARSRMEEVAFGDTKVTEQVSHFTK